MLNKNQIKLLQTALRAAGIRGKAIPDGRYRALLRQYKTPRGPVTSCKQLNNFQLTDLLAICESRGWRMPGKSAGHYRDKVRADYNYASFAQREAIRLMGSDLGWTEDHLAGMIKRMTKGRTDFLAELSPKEAFGLIEALKSMLGRKMGTSYKSLSDVTEDLKGGRDGQESKTKAISTG